jgi:hypothetical protein
MYWATQGDVFRGAKARSPGEQDCIFERRGKGCAGDEEVLIVNEHVIENVPTLDQVEQDCG